VLHIVQHRRLHSFHLDFIRAIREWSCWTRDIERKAVTGSGEQSQGRAPVSNQWFKTYPKFSVTSARKIRI
jgi:hypothetical protein